MERRREGADQQGLRDAGGAFEQHMAAAQQGDHQTADHRVLAVRTAFAISPRKASNAFRAVS